MLTAIEVMRASVKNGLQTRISLVCRPFFIPNEAPKRKLEAGRCWQRLDSVFVLVLRRQTERGGD